MSILAPARGHEGRCGAPPRPPCANTIVEANNMRIAEAQRGTKLACVVYRTCRCAAIVELLMMALRSRSAIPNFHPAAPRTRLTGRPNDASITFASPRRGWVRFSNDHVETFIRRRDRSEQANIHELYAHA